MMNLNRIWEHIKRRIARMLPQRGGGADNTSLIYQPLPHSEIRVVFLAPGKWDDRIHCTLKTVSLDDDPTYEILSYVWGDASIKKSIFLQNCNFQVTASLESALRHLRREREERTIWIDALCINQTDDAEKTEQVKLMQYIYARTSHLVVWVGDASEDSDLGMQTIKQTGEELKEGDYTDVDLANVSLIQNLPHAIKDFDPKPWVAINRLFRRAWFERIWVIQEICMPDAQMSFVCGRQTVPWDYASRVFHAVGRYRWGLERVVVLAKAGYTYSNMDAPVNALRELWKMKGETAEAQCTLMKRLWHFRGRKCGDPRDKIFAILGICKDLREGDIVVDYSFSVARVYSEVARFIFKRGHNLRLLSACQAYGKNVDDLPSWVPDWSIDARFRPMGMIASWETDAFQKYIYHASGSTSAPRVEISDDLKVFKVQGLVVGKISVLGTHIENDGDTIETPESQNRMFWLFKTWWPLAKSHTPKITADGERRIDAFWRTIIMDMNSLNYSQKATQEEEGAQFMLWMAEWNPSIFEPEDLDGYGNVQQYVNYLASFQQATRNRRFFITEAGRMGLGPRLVEPGDLVCVLLGSQVPFVLRAVDDHYVIVGECYCHGVMEGEAVKGLDKGEVAFQEFTLK